jgi:threonine/homoserine/homoserine lactone efflux protein
MDLNLLTGLTSSALVFGLINFPSVGVWAIVGQRLRGLLQGGRAQAMHLQPDPGAFAGPFPLCPSC